MHTRACVLRCAHAYAFARTRVSVCPFETPAPFLASSSLLLILASRPLFCAPDWRRVAPPRPAPVLVPASGACILRSTSSLQILLPADLPPGE
eukprot:5802350-Pleurochrysis_carterae.AAC.7